MNKIQVVILAAGHGQRMNHATLPKVLVPFRGQPLILCLLKAVKSANICKTPVIVIGQKAEQVKSVLGPNYNYIFQSQQLGTGHAVLCCQPILEGKIDNVMVLYADHPLLTSTTLTTLATIHLQNNSIISMATVSIPNYTGWRRCFWDLGRIVRKNGHVEKIVEMKDATDTQKLVPEVNPALYCFKAAWLWQNLPRLTNANSQGEYYLTDLVGMAIIQKQPVATVSITPEEGLGVNTPAQLQLAGSLLSVSI